MDQWKVFGIKEGTSGNPISIKTPWFHNRKDVSDMVKKLSESERVSNIRVDQRTIKNVTKEFI